MQTLFSDLKQLLIIIVIYPRMTDADNVNVNQIQIFHFFVFRSACRLVIWHFINKSVTTHPSKKSKKTLDRFLDG